MIKINKQGNALKIEFTDNDKYLNEGVMEIAPNELMVVVDSSDMATFKRVTNGDVLFSQTIDKIQIAGSAVTKDSILDVFASIGYTTGGGGGGTGAVSSVNGQTGDVVLTAGSLGVYTKAEVDTQINGLNDKVTNAVDVAGGAAQLADDVDESLKSHIKDFNSYKEEVRDELAGKQPVGEYATKSELVGLASKTDVEEKIDEKLADYYDKTEVDEAIKDAIPDISDLVTETELENYTYDKKTIDEKVAQGGTFDPTNYYDKSDVDGLLKDKADTNSVPTLQQEVKGTEKNYIYSDPTVQGKGAIAAARYRANSNGKLTAQYKYWGDTDFNYNTEFPTATETADGVMSKEDKIKLDSLTPGGGGTVDAYTKTEADNKFATKAQVNSKAPLPSVYNLAGPIQYDVVGQQGNSLSYGNVVSYNQINLGDIFDDGNYRSIVVSKGEKDGNYIVQLMPFHTNNPYSSNKGTMLGYQIVFSDPSQDTNSLDIFGLGIDGFTPKTIKAKSSSFSNLTNATSPSASITISSGSIQYSSVNIGDYLEITNSSSSTQILTLQVIGKYRSGSSYYVIFSGYQNVQLYVYSETTSSTKTLTKYLNFDPRNLSNIFMGQGITEMGSNNVAIGAYSAVQDQSGQSIDYGVAIGAGAMAQGMSAVAIGAYGTMAVGAYSTAVGGQSNANDATVIGSNLSNNNGEPVVIGHNRQAYIYVTKSGDTYITKGNSQFLAATTSDVAKKQDLLKSGTNIKTINGESILGSGNIEVATKQYVDEQIGDINSILTSINGE